MGLFRFLVIFLITSLVATYFWPWLRRLGFGKLPGDFVIHRGNSAISIPLASCLVLSVVLTLLFSILRK